MLQYIEQQQEIQQHVGDVNQQVQVSFSIVVQSIQVKALISAAPVIRSLPVNRVILNNNSLLRLRLKLNALGSVEINIYIRKVRAFGILILGLLEDCALSVKCIH